jgi:hemolysin III
MGEHGGSLAAAQEHSALLAADPRPAMRGTIHLAAALAAPFGLVWLLLIADSPSGYVGASIFAACLMLLYTSSATYHLAPWPRLMRGPRGRGVLKRLDHSMIFVLIAGTYTPFCLSVLGLGWGISMLAIVWSLAGAGILMKIAWPYAPRWLGVSLYLALGWIGIIPAAEVIARMDAVAVAMLLAGGLAYSVGGVIYALRRPDPFPRVFGFHEIFHVLVVAGSITHFALVALFVL